MDRRKRRTHRLLGEALIRLLQDRELHQITIKDITDQADVAYSTFFRNFDRVEDLLLSHLNGFVTTLMARITHDPRRSYLEQTQKTVTTIFMLCQEDPQLPLVLLRNPSARPILQVFQAEQVALNLNVIKQLRIPHDAQRPPMELILNNVVIQLFGMIEWWLLQKMRIPPEKMASYYIEIVLKPMWTLLLPGTQLNQLHIP